MTKQLLFIGLDVDDNAFHAHFISEDGKVEGSFSCKPSTGKLLQKLEPLHQGGADIRICYEATYLGFSLHRDLTAKGYHCDVIAPSLIPEMPGNKIKTDRLDSQKLAQFYRSGLLTIVRVPNEEEETIRDLLRSRKFIVNQIKDIKLHVNALCRRMGLDYRRELGNNSSEYWTNPHFAWLRDKIKNSKNSSLSFNLEMLLFQLDQIKSNFNTYEEKIEQISKSDVYKTKGQFLMAQSIFGLSCSN